MSSGIDLNRIVTDAIHLESLLGVIERLLQQCHDIGGPSMTDIKRVADSVVINFNGPLLIPAELRMYSALSVVLGGEKENGNTNYSGVVEALTRSCATGVLSALEQNQPEGMRFRVDPIPGRWELLELLTEKLGWRNEPGDWQVNIASNGGLLLAQVGPLYYSNRFPQMQRLPASTTPVIAAMLLQLLKPGIGQTVYDPFCGAGTLLVEAYAYDPGLVLLGSDISTYALKAAFGNQHLFPGGKLMQADAAHLPVSSESIDRIVSNIPFGKRVGSHAENQKMYPAFLSEVTRALRVDGRCVLLTEDKNLFRQSVEATRGLRILREVKLASGGAHPSAFVLERTRAARRRAKRP